MKSSTKSNAYCCDNCNAQSFDTCRCNRAAEANARKLGVIADYSNFDAKTAEMTNEALSETKSHLPGIKLPNIGTIEDCKELIQQAEYERIKNEVIYVNEPDDVIRAVASMTANSSANDFISNPVTSNSEAFYDEGTNTLLLKKQNAENNELFANRVSRAKEKAAVSVGTPKGTVDHELAHCIDKQLGICKKSEIANAYKAYKVRANPGELSVRAMNSVEEYVAEGWSEYCNSATPRPSAKFIGEYIVKLHDMLYNAN